MAIREQDMDEVIAKYQWSQEIAHVPAYVTWNEMRQKRARFQASLKTAGYNPGPIDGIVGPLTERAYEDWQFRGGSHPVDSGAREPTWVAVGKQELGTREVKGKYHNPKILDYWRWAHLNFKDDETPWCAGFCCYCLEKVGYESPRSGLAASFSWSSTMVKLKGPAVGAFRVSKRKGGHHVTMVVGKNKYGQVIGLGGNQNDMVCYAPYGATGSNVVGYYYPKQAWYTDGVKPNYELPLMAIYGNSVTEA